MNQFLESAILALQAIWANKLRSFMMVLGNVVAVTSIIAVVSLIQGMNGYVADSIVQEVGVGTFQVARVGVITNEEEEQEARRRNPDVTMVDLRAIKAGGESIDAVMAQSNAQANVSFRSETIENVGIRGVSADYDQFGGYDAEQGRTISRIEIQRSRPLAYLGVETAEKLFKGRTPVDQTIMVNGVHFRVVGVNERKGTLFGNSQDDFVLIPLGLFLLIALLVYAPSMTRGSRYRPGLTWWAEPVWFGGPADAEAALAVADPTREGGGTSARW